MKNILAKLGSKKIAGAVLVMATLLVGIGVISNFSDDSQKAANEAALSRFNENAFNNFGSMSSSRESLERQMLAQNSNTARFMQGKDSVDGSMDEDDAFSSDGAYAEGMYSNEGFVYAEDSSDPMYMQGAVDENGMPLARNGLDSKNSAFGAKGGVVPGSYVTAGANNGEEGGPAGAKNKKKSLKKDSKNKNKTALNKLAASSSGSSFKGGNTGGSANLGGAAELGKSSKDSGTRALPQQDVVAGEEDTASSKAFKMGRGGAMGGFNVARANGGSSGGARGDKGGHGAAEDLSNVAAYTSRSLESKTTAGTKNLSMAGFDGSGEFIGTTIDSGASINTVANQLLSGNTSNNLSSPNALNPANIIPPIQEINEYLDEINDLKKDMRVMYIALIAASLATSAAVYAVAKANFPYNMLVAGIIASVNQTVIIPTFLWVGKNSIHGLIEQIQDLSAQAGVNSNMGLMVTQFWITFGALSLVNTLCFAASLEKVKKAIEEFVKKTVEHYKEMLGKPMKYFAKF